jgi:hypothetical protein
MRRSGVVAGLATVALATALTGCGVRPPYPDWCRDLDDWLSDVYPVVEDADTPMSPEKGRDLAETLREHTDEVAQYPELASAFGSLITSFEEVAPGAEGLSDRRTLAEDVWDAFGSVHEPCPGPYY